MGRVTTLAELATAIDLSVPFDTAAEWDAVGIQFGDPTAMVGLVGVCHEVTDAVMAAARDDGIRTLVTYHPLLFSPVTALVAGTDAPGRAYRLIRDGVALISTHTAFDMAAGGAADALAAAVGITDAESFADQEDGLFIGRVGSVNTVKMGAFAEAVAAALGSANLRMGGNRSRQVSRVAVLPGSGGRAVAAAAANGADVLVTGDVSHHSAAEAQQLGIGVIDAGHAATERPGMARLYAMVSDVVGSAIDLTGISTDPWEG